MKPTAVLIGTFQVQIHWRLKVIAQRSDALEGQPRIGPHIHDVCRFVIVLSFAAQEFRRIEREPGIDTVALDTSGHPRDQFAGARVQSAGGAMGEQRDRHAPGALPRQTPVRTIVDHAGNARLAPLRGPMHVLDIAQRASTQPLGIHADKPLRRGTKDHRRFVPPTMRIAVRVRLLTQQSMPLNQFLDDHGSRRVDLETGHQCGIRRETPVCTDRIDDRQTVALADDEIVLPVCRRRMHRAGTGFERDVVTQNDRHLLRQPGVFQFNALKRRAGTTAEYFAFQSVTGQTGGGETFSQYQHLGSALALHQHAGVFDVTA